MCLFNTERINIALSFVHFNTFTPLMGIFMFENFARNNIGRDKCYRTMLHGYSINRL